MTPDELQALVEADEIDTVVMAFTDHFGRMMGKRFDAAFFVDEAIHEGTHGCTYLFTVDMEMEPVPGYEYANWRRGYGDFHLMPDLATLRRAGWTERTAFVLCDVHDGTDHEPVAVAPRSILRRQVERAFAMGLSVKAASELEFFLYDDSYREANERGYTDLRSSGWYNEDYHLLQGSRVEPFVGAARRALRRSEIPVESSKGEAALGQHELNVRYTDVLTMADRHVIMKQAMKELADAQGISATFMAKPDGAESGNSCHLHLSLWDIASGTNLFSDGSGGLSDEFRWFLGGWMGHLQELMVFYAPTVNSYKRYIEASWAPTRIAWSIDNRTAGFRVVGAGQSLRIECRIPGGDTNPYLAYAAALASGLDGIENRIEPPPRFDGDVYSAADQPRVTATLADSVEQFADSEFARQAFGTDVAAHYSHFFRSEVASFNAAVTDWERARYFERI